MDARPPVVLVGRGVTALGALRCLSRAGLEVYTSCDDPLVPRSRYYRPAVTRQGRRWRCELGKVGEEILADLPFSEAVIIPCADDMTMWVANLPADLTRRFRSSHPSIHALNTLQDKRQFFQLCNRLHVPHPRSYLIEKREDLDAIPFEEMPRAFFKPSNSIPFLQIYGVKGLWVQNRAEAHRIYQSVCDSQQSVFVQEYVAGGPNDHYFIDGFMDRNGEVCATFARRRERIFPLDFGNSSYCYHIPLEQVRPAWEALQKILRDVGYRGIFSAEFKQDAVEGTFKILEINTRVWVYVAFAAYCGIDMCQLAYLDACEERVPHPTVTRPGASCVDLYHDYCSVKAMAAGGQGPPLFKLMAQWWSSHKPVLSFTDPYPAMGWAMHTLGGRLGRIWSPKSANAGR